VSATESTALPNGSLLPSDVPNKSAASPVDDMRALRSCGRVKSMYMREI
jgi:hypothetical protein